MSRIRFEDTTPINKGNLDKLNNVVISPTAPTTGEEVWIKPAKNLFNINATPNKTYYCVPTIEGDTLKTSGSSVNFIGYLINVKPNTDYTVSVASKTGSINVYDATIDNYIAGMGSNNNSLTFNSGSHEQISLVFYGGGTFEKPQLEQGEIATTYEHYMNRKIYTKNDNGVYEEFYREIESGSNANGNYIKYGDGTLIQYGTVTKTITINNLASVTGWYYDDGYFVKTPLPFINTDYFATVIPFTNALTTLNVYSVNDYETNMFKFNLSSNIQYTADSYVFKWKAIGRWK